MAYFLDNVPPSQDTSIYPVGATYKQYVGESTPASLFGGTWTDITSTVAVGQDKIGYIYVQYPNQSDAATIFGGTWLNVSSLYAGLFFRAEGGSSLAFNAGNQTDAFQGHWHALGANQPYQLSNSINYGYNVSSTTPAIFQDGSYNSVRAATSDGTNGTPRTASETRPVNTTIRVWSRSGYSITIWRRTSTATSSIASPTNIVTGIYDSGTNSNGSWIRFTDGTMQCWGYNISISVGVNQGFTANYPINFTNDYSTGQTFTYSIVSNAGNLPTSYVGNGYPTTSQSLVVYTIAGSLCRITWQAIGKWK